VISDVHGNISALNAVFDSIRDLSEYSILCLGDMVGYYPFAPEVISSIRESGAIVVSGNHEEGIMLSHESVRERDYLWSQTRSALGEEDLSWIQALPRSLTLEVLGNRVGARHEYPLLERGYLYPDSQLHFKKSLFPEDILLFGHTHIQMLRKSQGKYFINPGSVGQPRNGRPGADFAVFDFDRRWVELRHIDYDVDSFAEKVASKTSALSLDLLTRKDDDRCRLNPCGSGVVGLEF